jgi:predicted outer membrane repeat protein
MLAVKSVCPVIMFPLILGLAFSTEAATRLVDGSVGADAGDCTASACATIGYAVDQATGDDTIDIADSIYTEMLQVDKSLTFAGESESGTIIQAHPDPFVATGRVLTLTGALDLTLSDLTIRHGKTGHGGGLGFDAPGNLTLTRVTFDQNSSGSGNGGGIDFHEVGCNVEMTDVSFVANEAGAGGGFYFRDCDLVVLEGVDLTHNSGVSCGGGGRLQRIDSAQLYGIHLIENSAGTSGGGGLCVLNSVIDATNIEFRGNFSNTAGGAIYSSNSTWTITNGLFTGNSAENTSSAIHNVTSASVTNLINVTLVGNRSGGVPGAINYVSSGMQIHNTIFWNNQNTNGIGSAQSSIWSFNSGADVQNSLVQGYSSGDLGGTGNFDGSLNPLFVSTPNPGAAPTTSGNLHLQEQSPVVDGGNNALISGVGTDLDELSRIYNGTVDLGPYEFGSGILFRDRFEQEGAP